MIKAKNLSTYTPIEHEYLLDNLLKSAHRLLPFDAISLALWDTEAEVLIPLYRHLGKTIADLPFLKLGEGVVGRVAESREAVILNNIEAVPYYMRVFDEMRAEMAAPIISNGELLGVLNVESQTADIYEENHLVFLQTLADQAAFVLETARLYDRLHFQYRELETHHQDTQLLNEIVGLIANAPNVRENLPLIAQHLATLSTSDAATIVVWDPKWNIPQRLAAWGLDRPLPVKNYQDRKGAFLIQKLIETHEPIIINDAQNLNPPPTPLIPEYGAKSILAIPLAPRGKGIGGLFLLRIHNTTPYTEADLQRLKHAVDQLAIGVDNLQLLNETQVKLTETSALLEIAAIAANTMHLNDMLKQVVALTCNMLNVRSSMLLLYDETSESLLPLPSGVGFESAIYEMQFPLQNVKDSLFVRVFSSNIPEFINDTSKLKGAEKQLVAKAQLKNILVVPLRVQDHPLGLFIVANRENGFAKPEVGLLMAMGSHIAAALRSNELYAATRDRLRETEALQQIAVITSETLDLDDMLTRVVQSMADLFGVNSIQLFIPHQATNTLRLHGASMFGEGHIGLPTEWELNREGFLVHVYHTGQPYLDNELRLDDVENILALPLNTRRKTLGVLALMNRREGKFEETHRELAAAIASQIAVSMEGAQLFAEERHRADLMSRVNQISQELTATLDPTGLMRKVAQQLHQLLHYEAVYFIQHDVDSNQFILRTQATAKPENRLEAGTLFNSDFGVIGRTITQKTTQLINDTVYVADFPDHGGLAWAKSVLIVPLRRDKTILGLVYIASGEKAAFGDADRVLMENLAAQISSALENARLYNQAQKRLLEQGIVQQIGQDLTAILDYQELLQAVARHMARALDTSSCLVGLYSPEEDAIRIEADYSINERTHDTHELLNIGQILPLSKRPAMRQAITTRKSVIVYRDDPNSNPDQHEVLVQVHKYSQLVLPMIVGDRVIGVVDWMEGRRPRTFSRDDERLGLTLVSQASIAVENARLFRESERRAREQALLREMAVRLGSMLSLDDILPYLVREIRVALEGSNAAIALVDESGEVTTRVYDLTTFEENQLFTTKVSRKRDASVVWREFQKGRSLVFRPGHTPPELGTSDEFTYFDLYPTGIVMVVPIHRRGRLMGFIEVTLELPNIRFEDNKTQLLESIADQAASAIDSTRLYQREQRRLRQIERVQSSGRLISSELVMQNLLDLIVEEAAGIFEVSAVTLEMPDATKRYYVVHAAHGLSQDFIQQRRGLIDKKNLEDTTTELLRIPFYIPDLVSYELNNHNEDQANLCRQEKLQSVLIVPLVKGKNILGNLNLYSYESEDLKYHFTEEDIEIAQLLASQVTIAFDNADLFRKLEERALELAEANRLKSQFLATISHELRTPMNSILGFSDTLLTGIYGALNEKQISRLERIHRNGRNLLALIDDLLDLSKIDAGRMEIELLELNLHDEIQTCISSIESQVQAKNLYLRIEIPNNLPKIIADPLRLRQVINNLLGNAVKFTKDGGVTVKIEEYYDKTDDEKTHLMLATSVIDTGIGIGPNDQPIIFDEFRQADGSTTRQYGGTGLGLAISKRLIELMGGRIWVDSEVGHGSTFTFTLPIVEL